MRAFAIGLATGAFVLQSSAALPHDAPWVPLVLALATTLVCAWLPRDRASARWLAALGLFIAGALTGWAYAHHRAAGRLAEELPPQWEGRDIEIVGVVDSLPTRSERGVRFLADVDTILTPGAIVPRNLSLMWYAETDRKRDVTTPPPELIPGERWQLTVRLRRPHGSANLHGFDFEAWALERNIRATGYVRGKEDNRRLTPPVAGASYAVDRLRLAIRERMKQALGDRPYAGVLIALAIGEQNAIPEHQWKSFWRTGTGHLMSISGLHITMVAALVYWLAWHLWARWGAAARRFPAQRVAALAGALAALGYSLIAGFSVPTQRTFFMLATAAVALCLSRQLSAFRILCCALAAVVLIDPWCVLAPGFWLSFGAVAAIFHATGHRSGRSGAIGGAVRVQAAVTFGLLPLTLALFQEVSLISPVANAIAIPVVSWVVVPLTLLGAVAPFDGLLHVAHHVMSLTYDGLTWLAATPHAVWQSHAPVAWTVALAIAGVGVWLMPRGAPLRWAGPMAMVPMFAVLPPSPGPGELWVSLLDVGQGLSAVVRTAHHALVYDAGPRWNPDTDAGSRIVVPYLRGEGIRSLDAVVITHDDEDHSGGARAVIDARQPQWILTSVDDDRDYLIGSRETIRCVAGQRWQWDGVDFDVLHPTDEAYREARKTNNMGCVIKMTAPGGSLLMTADIEKPSEAELIGQDAARLKADVLVVPHHGSKTSSTPGFLDAVAPRLALVPVGYRNRFRHPHPDVLARYRERDIAVLRTDRDGAIALKFSPQSNAMPSIERYRQTARRYWTDDGGTASLAE